MTHEVIPTQNHDPSIKLRFMHHVAPTFIIFALAIWPIFLNPAMPFYWALVSVVPGLCFALSLFLFGYGTRQLLITDRRKRSVAQLEQNLFKNDGEPDINALARLTDQHRRLGRLWAGEFLSKQLLHIAEQPEHFLETAKLRSTDCFVSTPAYHSSMTCFTIDSTQSHGVLYLTENVLAMESKEIFFAVPLESIVSVTIDKLPAWCMMPHTYVVVRFLHDGETHEVHLNPAPSMTISLNSINAAVEKWHTILSDAVARSRTDQRQQLIAVDDLKSELVVRRISLPQRFVNCALSQPFLVALSLTFTGCFAALVPLLINIMYAVAHAPPSPF